MSLYCSSYDYFHEWVLILNFYNTNGYCGVLSFQYL